MNILVIMRNPPRPDSGASIRNYSLLKALARENDITLLVIEDISALDICGSSESLVSDAHQVLVDFTRKKRLHQLRSAVTGRSFLLTAYTGRRTREAIDMLVRRRSYDAILFESVLVAGYQPPSTVKVIIDQHNIEHEILWRTAQQEISWIRRWHSRMEYARLRKGELARCRGANLLLVTSERERQIYARLLPEVHTALVPNGVDLARFQPGSLQSEVNGRLVFTGLMSYRPNAHGVLLFAKHCWPRIHERLPHATWEIVGAEPPAEVQRLAALPGVTVTGQVPAIQPHLAAASVVIAPLFIGSGTRIKILEAFAMRKAVVSTSTGCEGLAVTPGHHLMVADELDQFADEVVSLLQQPAKRQSLAVAGRALVEEQYSWAVCGERLLEAVRSVM